MTTLYFEVVNSKILKILNFASPRCNKQLKPGAKTDAKLFERSASF
jgi:hypothetical protein